MSIACQGCQKDLVNVYLDTNMGFMCESDTGAKYEIVNAQGTGRKIKILNHKTGTTQTWMPSVPPSNKIINLNAKHFVIFKELSRFNNDCDMLIAVGSWGSRFSAPYGLWLYDLETSSEVSHQWIKESVYKQLAPENWPNQ